MDKHIVKVENLTREELEELVEQLDMGCWMATDKNVTFEVIDDQKT